MPFLRWICSGLGRRCRGRCAVRPAVAADRQRQVLLAEHQPLEPRAGAADAALDRTDLAAADRGRLLVGQALDTDEHQHLPLPGIERAEGLAEREHIDQRRLRRPSPRLADVLARGARWWGGDWAGW